MKKALVLLLVLTMMLTMLTAYATDKYDDYANILKRTWDVPLKNQYSELTYNEEESVAHLKLSMASLPPEYAWVLPNVQKTASQLCDLFVSLENAMRDDDELVISLTTDLTKFPDYMILRNDGLVSIVAVSNQSIVYQYNVK